MGWRIGSIGGVPLYLAKSWPIGALLIGYVYFISFNNYATTGRAALISAIAVVMLFFSVLVHEVSHGVVGKLQKRPPESYTLTLFGGHTTFRTPDPSPGAMAIISLAGPLANLALAALAWAGTLLPVVGPYMEPLVIVNLILGLFNLAPGLPMDGGYIVAAIGWFATDSRERGMEISGWTGRVIAGLIAAAAVFWLLLTQGRSTSALWMIFIAIFLWQGASRSIHVAKARQAVTHVDLRPLMMPVPAIEHTKAIRDVPPTGAVLVDRGWPVAFIPIQNVGGNVDPNAPATAISLAVPRRNVITTPVGADAVTAVAGAEGDLVILTDGGYYWAGSVRQIATHVNR